MEEIGSAIRLANTKPEEAAQNIERSEMFNIPPDSYKDLKPNLEQEAEVLERPTATTDGVGQYMKQSSQHASVARDDIDTMGYMERQARFIWNHVSELPTIDREIVDLNNDHMDNPEQWDDNKQQILDGLNSERAEKGQEDYGIEGPIEKLPGQVLGVVSDIARGVGDNAALVATTTAAGAGLGGAVSLGIPIPGARVVGVGAAGAAEVGASGVGAAGSSGAAGADAGASVVGTASPLKADFASSTLS